MVLIPLLPQDTSLLCFPPEPDPILESQVTKLFSLFPNIPILTLLISDLSLTTLTVAIETLTVAIVLQGGELVNYEISISH